MRTNGIHVLTTVTTNFSEADRVVLSKGLPTELLGKKYGGWRKQDIHKILAFYNPEADLNGSQLDSWPALRTVINEYNLVPWHRNLLLKAQNLEQHSPSSVPLPKHWAHSRHQECSICEQHLERDHFPLNSITPSCKHVSHVCRECLTKSLEEQVKAKHWSSIKCPECVELLHYDDIRTWTTGATFYGYVRLSALITLVLTPPAIDELTCATRGLYIPSIIHAHIKTAEVAGTTARKQMTSLNAQVAGGGPAWSASKHTIPT